MICGMGFSAVESAGRVREYSLHGPSLSTGERIRWRDDCYREYVFLPPDDGSLSVDIRTSSIRAHHSGIGQMLSEGGSGSCTTRHRG